LELAVQEIRRTLPTGSRFILVDGDGWGNGARALSGFHLIPFVELNGRYWGLPADDSTALSELQRLRKMEPSHIVFAWDCFWWLEHYCGLDRWLRSACELVLENERLKIFRFPLP
jgi:hypothetical protein